MSFIIRLFRRVFNQEQLKKNNRCLSLIQFFRRSAGKLAGFFQPIFLYQLSKTHFEALDQFYTPLQKAMVIIASYYLLERLFISVFSIVAGSLVEKKLGHKLGLIIGSLAYAGHFLALYYADSFPWLVFVAALVLGLSSVFFWQSYNTLISYNSPSSCMGKSLSLLVLWKNLVSMVMPLVGGLIIALFGFDYLFLASILFILLSIIAVAGMDIEDEKDEVSLKEYLDWLQEKRFDQLFLSQSGRYFYDMSLTLWPLYIFVLLGDVKKIGLIYSLALFFSTIINLFTGSFLDKKQRSRLPYFFSGGILSLLWLARGAISSAWSIVVVDSCDQLVGGFHWLYFDRALFHRGQGREAFSYFVYRMTNRSIASVIFWLLLLGFFLFVPVGWNGLFVLGMIGALLSLLMQDRVRSSEKEAV
ncbi:MAG: MFS transporter [Candidatus Pacebacteria bacterium]|nr:MFS transporter [Candidatus Paceibacterota bacterium]